MKRKNIKLFSILFLTGTILFSFTLNAKSKKERVEEYNEQCVDLTSNGDYEQAIKFCDKAIKLDPSCYQCYNNRGSAKFIIKDFKGAIADFDKVLELKPKFPPAYLYRGIIKVQEFGDQINMIQGCMDLAFAVDNMKEPYAEKYFKKYCKSSGAHKDGQSDEPAFNPKEIE